MSSHSFSSFSSSFFFLCNPVQAPFYTAEAPAPIEGFSVKKAAPRRAGDDSASDAHKAEGEEEAAHAEEHGLHYCAPGEGSLVVWWCGIGESERTEGRGESEEKSCGEAKEDGGGGGGDEGGGGGRGDDDDAGSQRSREEKEDDAGRREECWEDECAGRDKS
eukprot:542164-Rhodomonas_salina.2